MTFRDASLITITTLSVAGIAAIHFTRPKRLSKRIRARGTKHLPNRLSFLR